MNTDMKYEGGTLDPRLIQSEGAADAQGYVSQKGYMGGMSTRIGEQQATNRKLIEALKQKLTPVLAKPETERAPAGNTAKSMPTQLAVNLDRIMTDEMNITVALENLLDQVLL